MAPRPRLLLTGPVDEDTARELSELADVVQAPDASADTLRRLVADAEILVVRSALPSDLLDFAPRLRGIVRHGVGVDMIPVDAATARGIAVANVPGSNRHAVAEHVMGALTLLRRRSARMDAVLRSDGWARSRALADGAVELHGHVIGVVGLGAVGSRVAEIAHHGYGMTVLIVALREGRLGGAALDVFASRPLEPEHALFGLDNLLLTPHAAGLTIDSMRCMGRGTVAEVGRIVAGLPVLNCVNLADLAAADMAG